MGVKVWGPGVVGTAAACGRARLSESVMTFLSIVFVLSFCLLVCYRKFAKVQDVLEIDSEIIFSGIFLWFLRSQFRDNVILIFGLISLNCDVKILLWTLCYVFFLLDRIVSDYSSFQVSKFIKFTGVIICRLSK